MNEEFKKTGAKASETANLIWSVADVLVGPYKPHEYGLVILPMCVIKRFHDCLRDRHDAILEANRKFPGGPLREQFLKKASGYQFYNTSRFTFDLLKADPENIAANFRDYINGFSENVQSILTRMEFSTQIDKMADTNTLYEVISKFSESKLNMDEEHITTVDMGYIFENLVQKFSESYDEHAGAHFTSRDIIYLMCDLLLTNSHIGQGGDGIHCSVYDMTMGTSQMLTCMEERLKELDADADVKTFGQEFNAFTMGIAAADTIIHGGDADNMQYGDTLSEDKFTGYKFDFIISNPPFGIPWNKEAEAVEAEYKKGSAGRFEPGLPPKGDGQMLFLLNGIAKLKKNGKMAIIQNGSPLFSGDAGSGPSEIRRYVIEHDWLDAIIQLPNNSFYNTDISTYIWIIDKEKPFRNPGKVLMVDASACCEPRRKSIGKKRFDITEMSRSLIVETYGKYCGGEETVTMTNGNSITCKSMVVDCASLGYSKVTVERPLRDEKGNVVLKRGKPVADSSLRDTESIPLTEDMQEYFDREVKPYAPDAWIDESKTKVGYEIPMTRYFYKYEAPESVEDIQTRISELELDIQSALNGIFDEV